MMPRLGKKYDLEIETISKPREEYNTDEHFELDLPVAPAVMVDDEIVVEGTDISEAKLEAVILKHACAHGLEPEKKGLLSRFLRK